MQEAGRHPGGGGSGRFAAWMPGILAFGFLVFFAAFVAWFYSTVLDAGRRQTEIRSAISARALVFRLQLDEETGLRGYTSTLRRDFLQPYVTASARIDEAFKRQRTTLLAVEPGYAFDSPMSEEEALHARWLRAVALPLIAAPRAPGALQRQTEGKELIDRFRDINDSIAADLLQRSAAIDARLQALLRTLIAWSFVGAASLAALSVFLTRYGVDAQSRIGRERERYENEKLIADQLQQALLQRELPDVEGLRFDAIYLPAEEQSRVGGDWYSAFAMPDGRILFSIGDVCGHGIEAAVIMSRARQSILAAALPGHDPAEILKLVNRSLILQGNTMVTAICGFIDPATASIDYATAGHPPPILADASGPHFLPQDGLPMGILPELGYRAFHVDVSPPCLLVLYTDGVVEQHRNIREGEAGLLHAIAGLADTDTPAAEGLRRLLFSGPPADDAAILAIRFERPANVLRRADSSARAAQRLPHVSSIQGRAVAAPSESDEDARDELGLSLSLTAAGGRRR